MGFLQEGVEIRSVSVGWFDISNKVVVGRGGGGEVAYGGGFDFGGISINIGVVIGVYFVEEKGIGGAGSSICDAQASRGGHPKREEGRGIRRGVDNGGGGDEGEDEDNECVMGAHLGLMGRTLIMLGPLPLKITISSWVGVVAFVSFVGGGVSSRGSVADSSLEFCAGAGGIVYAGGCFSIGWGVD